MTITTSAPGRTPTLYGVSIHRDVRIPTDDPAVTLAADLWRPVTDQPTPALLMLLPYRKDFLGGLKYQAWQQFFAQRGYACLLVDTRGVGSSDGAARSLLDTGQGEDGVAAVAWAASQPWCSGDVGMWGHCAGGLTTLATAHRRPPQLKAAIVQAAPHDVKTDAMYPGGARSIVHNLVRRTGTNLLYQLLPSLLDPSSPEEHRRWRDRLRALDPALLTGNLAPTDPAWQDWRLDPARITIPTLCTTGWRDLYTDPMVRAYERLGGPKKLLVGPWMHTLPNEAPVEALEYLPILLRWWDHWLRGEPNDVMTEPPVTVYVQGARPGWRHYPSWPPGYATIKLATGRDTTLEAGQTGGVPAPSPIAEHQPDPTVGTASGLCNIGAGRGGPLDQSDDDHRALACTSDPLAIEQIIAGVPEVVVYVPDGHPPVPRLVARLCDVDPEGRSTLITAGINSGAPGPVYRVSLRRTAYRVAAGHRVRVALSDADFPLLQPLANPAPIPVTGVELALPIAAPTLGEDTTLPAVDRSATLAAIPPGFGGHWTITRDPINDGVEVSFGSRLDATSPVGGHRIDFADDTHASVLAAHPENATVTGTYRCAVDLRTGETITAEVKIRCTRAVLWAHAAVTIDRDTVYSRSWESPIWTDEHEHPRRIPEAEQLAELRAGLILQ